MMPNASTCHGQEMPEARARPPTITAAIPNHRKGTPGMIVSRVKSRIARNSQFHAPNPYNSARTSIVAPLADLPSPLRRRHAARPVRPRRKGRGAGLAIAAERLAADLGEACERADHRSGLERHHQDLLVRRL